MSIMMVDN